VEKILVSDSHTHLLNMDMTGDAAHLADKAWMQPNGKVATLCNFNDVSLQALTQRMLSDIMQFKSPYLQQTSLQHTMGGSICWV